MQRGKHCAAFGGNYGCSDEASRLLKDPWGREAFLTQPSEKNVTGGKSDTISGGSATGLVEVIVILPR